MVGCAFFIGCGKILTNVTMLRRIVSKYVNEVKKATTPRAIDYGEQLTLWDFTKPESLEKWLCFTDKDVGGFSRATFEPNGKGIGAVFHGSLSTQVPADNDKVKYSGYCSIKAKPKKKEFLESDRTDVSTYDAFLMRVRGDGRKYIFNVESPGMARTDDLWQWFMFTRGGPEWEDIVLPFKNFFITNYGYLQDHPVALPTQTLYTVGLLLADRTNGPFRLEIQHIKAIRRLTID